TLPCTPAGCANATNWKTDVLSGVVVHAGRTVAIFVTPAYDVMTRACPAPVPPVMRTMRPL
ncbi:MAG: hypothetical protein ACO27F_15005, partial [Beijerinckiaceae bacterium]